MFSIQTERVVDKDNTVAIKDCRWQIEKCRWRYSLADRTVTIHQHLNGTVSIRFGPHVVGRYAESGRPWNHPKAVEKTVPWKPWKTKPRFPTAPTAPWKTRNLGEFPTFPPPCDSPFPSLKKTKGKEGSMKQADRSSVKASGQIVC
ncbi:MAG: hypothetical protein DMG59_09980 [Acidobacteria bacterium]|nr:MAG: hypothetical protein DMG59_09980 [Acidobacteriota bacterium]